MCNYLHRALLVPKDLADVHKSETKSRQMFKYQAQRKYYIHLQKFVTKKYADF